MDIGNYLQSLSYPVAAILACEARGDEVKPPDLFISWRNDERKRHKFIWPLVSGNKDGPNITYTISGTCSGW